MTSPAPVTSASPDAGSVRPQGRARPGAEDAGWDREYGRDVWRIRELGITDRGIAHISFTGIPQPWLKNLAKRWARWRLSTGQVAETAALSVLAVRRFAAFLASPAVTVDRLAQVDRPLLERYLAAARSTDPATRAKHASLWATHCEPQWADWQMSAITRMEAQEWVNRLQATRRARHKGRDVTDHDQDVPVIGAETVCAAVHLMSQLYSMAAKETPPIVLVNPFAELELPVIRPHEIDFLERDEAELLFAAAGEIGARWRILIELGTEVGLRPGELYGLHGHRVDWLRGKIRVIDVMTRTGLRQWPKSKKSHRIVPAPAHILEGMSALMAGRPRDALVFTAPEGGPVDDGNFRDRIWYRAVEATRIRRFPPRIMRHTAASWLVIDGVPLYDVQALLGHESYRTTERYAHLAPDAHDKVVQSWARRLDASVTHERRKDNLE